VEPLRISVTTLESYRLYLTTDWMTEERLMGDLTQFRETPEMRAGKAFHSILEAPDACQQGGGYVADGHVFPASVVEPCLSWVDRAGAFEVKLPKVYRVGGEDVTVVAKVDQLLGVRIREHKTKWSPFDIDAYALSCQWRFYVDIFEGARAVDYRVFRLSERKDGYELDGIEAFSVYPYPRLAADCRDLLASFVDYIRRRQLGEYFQPRAA
jgi:hypothetical protein